MDVDIWADLVCPFCYLGKRRFEQALASFPHADEVTVRWHSFELDRQAPAVADSSLVELVAAKYGTTIEQATAQHEQMALDAAELGLTFNYRDARYGNTFDAHRMVHFAADRGLADEAEETLMRAYFTEGKALGERDTLVSAAESIGLDVDEVRAMLDGDEYGNHVRSDEATANMLGISSVPFFVLDRRYGVSGAQPSEVFAQALQQAWDSKDEPREASQAAGGGCGGDCCGGACGQPA